MLITLIRPPAYSIGLMGPQLVPYLGIAYVAASLRAAGHTVDIIDMCAEDIDRRDVLPSGHVQYGMAPEALAQRLRPSAAIGFTCMFSQEWPFNRQLIERVRALAPGSVLIAGGEHITALPEYSLKDCPALDVCVVGEGEHTAVRLAETLKNKGDLGQVKGLVFRRRPGLELVATGRADRIRDIDSLPWPAWDLLPLENYLARGLNYHISRGRTVPMLATRGCPYKCTFCSNTGMWGAPWLARSPKNVVDEMEHYVKTCRAENFVFSDLTAVVRREKIIELCREILDRKIDVTWQLPTLRTEAVDREVLELMVRAGCTELDFAIESGSAPVLASVEKHNDPRKIFALIREGLAAGINLSTNIVIGLPAEGWRDFFRTYLLMMRLAVVGLQELNVFPFIPYPGSRLFAEYLDGQRIRLGDEYFYKLFGYADLGQALSWSAHFGPRTVSTLRFLLLSSFYGLMFLTHPLRLGRLIMNAAKGRTTTKLEGVLRRVFGNVRVSFSRKRYAK